MKIGIFSPYLNTLGGGERYMLTIAEYLSDEHQVDIFWDDQSIIAKAQQYLNIKLEQTHIVPNIFTRTHSLFERVRKGLTYDVIIYLSDGSIPTLAAKKNILHFQRPFIDRNLTIYDQIKLRSIAHIICNSNFTKQYIDTVFQVKSSTLYPPVATYKASSAVKKKIIISVGRFSTVPGNKKQLEMVDFFNKLSQKMPAWQLVLAGGLLPKDKAYVDEITKHIASPIKVFPNISYSDLVTLYGEASIYWHAAGYGENEKTHPERFEHFGISTVEAMMSGCVPIVFNGGGQREIVKNNIEGILWNTEDELLASTIEVAENEKLARRLSDNAIKKSSQFSKDIFCEQIRKLIS